MGRKYFRGRNAFGNELAHCRGSRPKMAERRSRCKRERARAIRASLVSRVRTRARAQLPDDPLPSWHIPASWGGVAWRPGDIRRSIVYLLPERALRFPLSPNSGKIFQGGRGGPQRRLSPKSGTVYGCNNYLTQNVRPFGAFGNGNQIQASGQSLCGPREGLVPWKNMWPEVESPSQYSPDSRS